MGYSLCLSRLLIAPQKNLQPLAHSYHACLPVYRCPEPPAPSFPLTPSNQFLLIPTPTLPLLQLFLRCLSTGSGSTPLPLDVLWDLLQLFIHEDCHMFNAPRLSILQSSSQFMLTGTERVIFYPILQLRKLSLRRQRGFPSFQYYTVGLLLNLVRTLLCVRVICITAYTFSLFFRCIFMYALIYTHTFMYIMPLVQQTPKSKVSLLVFCLYVKEMLKRQWWTIHHLTNIFSRPLCKEDCVS